VSTCVRSPFNFLSFFLSFFLRVFQHKPALVSHEKAHGMLLNMRQSPLRDFFTRTRINAPWELARGKGLCFRFALDPVCSRAFLVDDISRESDSESDSQSEADAEPEQKRDASDAGRRKSDGRANNRGSRTRKRYSVKFKSIVLDALDKACEDEVSNPGTFIAESFNISPSCVTQWSKPLQRVC
jgi:hypothetical protein